MHVLSVRSWHTLATPESASEPAVVTHRSSVGQSVDTTHAVWHREKTQTSGELQSLLSVHPGAATGVELEQPAMASAAGRTTAKYVRAVRGVPHCEWINTRASDRGTLPESGVTVNERALSILSLSFQAGRDGDSPSLWLMFWVGSALEPRPAFQQDYWLAQFAQPNGMLSRDIRIHVGVDRGCHLREILDIQRLPSGAEVDASLGSRADERIDVPGQASPSVPKRLSPRRESPVDQRSKRRRLGGVGLFERKELDHRARHRGGREERRRAHSPNALYVENSPYEDGQRSVVLGRGRRPQTLGDLVLDHEHHTLQVLRAFRSAAQERTRDSVRQVSAKNAWRPLVSWSQETYQIDILGVLLDHTHARDGSEFADEQRDELSVALDRAQRLRTLGEPPCERTRARTDFNDASPPPFPHGHTGCCDLARDGFRHKEVLTEGLLGSQPGIVEHTTRIAALVRGPRAWGVSLLAGSNGFLDSDVLRVKGARTRLTLAP